MVIEKCPSAVVTARSENGRSVLETAVQHGHFGVLYHIVINIARAPLSHEHFQCLLEIIVNIGDGHSLRLLIDHLQKMKEIKHDAGTLIFSKTARRYYISQMLLYSCTCSEMRMVAEEAYIQGSAFFLDKHVENERPNVPFRLCNSQEVTLNMKCLDIILQVDVDSEFVSELLHSACLLGHICAVKQLTKQMSLTRETLASLFQIACCFSYTDIAKELISYVNVNMTFDNGMTPLHITCKRGNMDLTAALFEADSDVYHKDKDGKTALYIACYYMHLDIAELLLEYGAKAVSSQGPSPLHLVCRRQDSEMLKLLLHSSPQSVNDADSDGNSPLLVSVNYCYKLGVEALLDHQADLNFTDNKGRIALHVAFERGNKEIIQLLLKHTTSIFQRNMEMVMPVSILYKQPSLFQLVCECIPVHCLTEADDDGNTLLHHACISGFYECVQLLLHRGVDKSHVNKNKETALHLAVEKGCQKSVSALIQFGYSMNTKNSDLQTPLDIACAEGCLEIVVILLDCGSEVNVNDTSCMMPLHTAAKNGHSQIVQLLISKISWTDMADSIGDIPLHLACDSGDLESVQILVKHTPDINVFGHKGRTPLHRAVARGYINIVDYLLNNGAISLPNRFNNAPLYAACVGGHLEIMKLLLKHGDILQISGVNGYFYVIVSCIRSHMNILEYLINNGAFISPQGISCPTPFSWTMSDIFEDEEDNIEYVQKSVATGTEGRTPIDVALDQNNIDIVKFLLTESVTRGLDICEDDSLKYILNKICRKGTLEIVKLFLSSTKIEATDMKDMIKEMSENLKCIETSNNDTVHVKELEKGVMEVIDEDETITVGESPVVTACKSQHYDIASLLIVFASGTLNDMDESHVYENQSPLHLAYDLGMTEVVLLLLSEKIHTTVEDAQGYTVFHKACECGNMDIVKALFDIYNKTIVKEVWKRETLNGEMMLHIAARKGYTDIIKLFLKTYVDMFITSWDGNNALHTACSYDRYKICFLLLDKVPSLVAASNNNGLTPLDVTVRRGNLRCLKAFMICRHPSTTEQIHDKMWKYSYNSLHANDLHLFRLLLKCDQYVDLVDKNSNTVFHICARMGNSIVMDYLAKNADRKFTMTRNIHGDTPLHIASWHGHMEIVKCLAQISNIDARNNYGDNPLHFAAFNSHADIVALLLASGADVTAINLYGDTPLHVAVCGGIDTSPEYGPRHIFQIPLEQILCTVQILIDYRPDMSKENGGSKECRQITDLEAGKTQRTVSSLFDKISLPNRNEKSPFYLACEYGHESVVEILLNLTDIVDHEKHVLASDCNPGSGSTVLHLACHRNCTRLVSLLLGHGADTSIWDNDGNSPILVACEGGHTNILELLLPYSNLTTNLNTNGGTVLHDVSSSGHIDMLGLILDNVQKDHQQKQSRNSSSIVYPNINSLLNQMDNGSQTALHLACQYGNTECVQQLLQHRPRLNLSDNKGRTPLHYASRSGCVDLMILLLQHDVCLSAADTFGMTPLHYACLTGSLEVAGKLVDAGADPHIRGGNGAAPLDMCSQDLRDSLIERYRYKRKRHLSNSTSSDVDCVPKWAKTS